MLQSVGNQNVTDEAFEGIRLVVRVLLLRPHKALQELLGLEFGIGSPRHLPRNPEDHHLKVRARRGRCQAQGRPSDSEPLMPGSCAEPEWA